MGFYFPSSMLVWVFLCSKKAYLCLAQTLKTVSSILWLNTLLQSKNHIYFVFPREASIDSIDWIWPLVSPTLKGIIDSRMLMYHVYNSSSHTVLYCTTPWLAMKSIVWPRSSVLTWLYCLIPVVVYGPGCVMETTRLSYPKVKPPQSSVLFDFSLRGNCNQAPL